MRDPELVHHSGINLIGQMQWSFSFQQRERRSEAYYANLAE
jgi:hypothetical protein